MRILEFESELRRRAPNYRRTRGVLTNQLGRYTGRYSGPDTELWDDWVGSGYLIDYDREDVERAVAFVRMNAVGGVMAGVTSALRREAQDAIPTEHEPGWICMSEGRAWFQADDPIEAVLSGRGVMAIRVHDDCACLLDKRTPVQ